MLLWAKKVDLELVDQVEWTFRDSGSASNLKNGECGSC